MPKYYTQCLTTPSIAKSSKNYEYDFVFKKNSPGYLFFNSEGIKDFRDLHKAVWLLSGLYEEAKGVYAIRLDPYHVMVSFNTNSVPRPTLIQRYGTTPHEWLSKHRPQGWLIENIRELNTPVVPVNWSQVYDECLHLERMTDACPCPRLAEGTCFSETLFKVMPALEHDLADYSTPGAPAHQVNRYKEIDGYEFLPGQYMVEGAFVESLRPYDNYDFDLVQIRRKEFKDRGQRMATRNAHRREECSKCVYQRKSKGQVTDCGWIDQCTTAVSEADTEELLTRWYKEFTPYENGTDGFTYEEIRYLIGVSGVTFEHSNLFNKKKAGRVMLAGFHAPHNGSPLVYRVVPTSGLVSRSLEFHSYADLRMAISDLPMDAPYHYVPAKMKLAHAVLSTQPLVRTRGNSWHKYALINKGDYRLEAWGYSGKKLIHAITIEDDYRYSRLFKEIWYHGQHVEIKGMKTSEHLYPLIVPGKNSQQYY